MSSNYSPNSGRSRSGGGGRRRSSGSKSSYSKTGQGSPRGEERVHSHASNRPSVQKKGFFAKLLSFLGLSGKKKPAATGQPRRTPRGAQSEHRESSSPRQSRKPERIEVTTPRVYVGNLSFDASESDLLELFRGVGSVQSVEVVCNRETQRSKGFGFVTLSSIEEAKRAVAELHDKEYMTRKLVVSGAKAVAESRSERSERRDTAEASESSTTSEAAAA